MVGHLPGGGTGHFGMSQMIGCLYMYVGLYLYLKPQKQMFWAHFPHVGDICDLVLGLSLSVS